MTIKISENHVFQVNLPVVNGPYAYSGGALHKLDSTIAELRFYRECCPCCPTIAAEHGPGTRAALFESANYLLGLNPLTIIAVHKKMENEGEQFGRPLHSYP